MQCEVMTIMCVWSVVEGQSEDSHVLRSVRVLAGAVDHWLAGSLSLSSYFYITLFYSVDLIHCQPQLFI